MLITQHWPILRWSRSSFNPLRAGGQAASVLLLATRAGGRAGQAALVFMSQAIHFTGYLSSFLSFLPSFHPSFLPSILPSFLPSFLPSVRPSVRPSFLPSFLPPSFRVDRRFAVDFFLDPIPFFPTCQVRVFKIYQSCSSPPPSSSSFLLLLRVLLLFYHLCLHFHVHCCLANS